MNFLTIDRTALYASASMCVGIIVLTLSLWHEPIRLVAAVDFPAFYNAGRIINLGRREDLYDRDLQQRLFQELAPDRDISRASLYVYPPFFALLFSPIALLPYPVAFAVWALISLGLFAFGFYLVWQAAGLPRDWRKPLLIAISFLPFYAWCLGMGQTSAFGFLWLALAIYLERQRRFFASGLSLAMLVYKPPLLVLLLPMLLITKRWRTLVGFCSGTAILCLVSFLVIGFDGLSSYERMNARFANRKVSTDTTSLEIDGFSFFLSLFRGNARWAAIALFVVAIPLIAVLVRRWNRDPMHAWATTITWTLVLNFYVLLYDSTLVILAVVLSLPARLPASLKILLIVLFFVPWIHTGMAAHLGFLPLTLVLASFGLYQLRGMKLTDP